jgi:transcriptional regulator of met regulon
VLGFFSHFFSETLHSACDGARAKSPNVFLGASTAQLQIPFTVLTTLLQDAQMPDISSKRHERVQATASSLCCACLHAYASLPAPLNQSDITRCLATQTHAAKYRNPSLYHNLTGGRMRHGAYGLPNLRRFRLLNLAPISRISQLSAMPLQNCSCARSQNNTNTIPRSPTSLSWLELRAPIGSGTEVYGTCIFPGIARSTPSDAAWRGEFCHRQICFVDACTGTNTSILIY